VAAGRSSGSISGDNPGEFPVSVAKEGFTLSIISFFPFLFKIDLIKRSITSQ
jgi:hypothetical protein